jgi:siroheme synthase (precorrin-2 oxidase/ferrochelatase)
VDTPHAQRIPVANVDSPREFLSTDFIFIFIVDEKILTIYVVHTIKRMEIL